MLTSSGQAANFFAVFNIASAGDHVVASNSIYGGTYNLFAVTMAKMGIEFTFVSPDCTAEELDAAFQPNTKTVFGETIDGLDVIDRIAEVQTDQNDRPVSDVRIVGIRLDRDAIQENE